MPPAGGGEFCFAHAPELAAERAAARKRGGVRRRRPKVEVPQSTLLRDVASAQVLLEVAAGDTLQLENGVQRNRVLGYLANTAIRIIEVGELEQRVSALEERLASGHPMSVVS